MAIGYNKTKDEGNRHYRKYFENELEEIKEIMPKKPFFEEVIYREAPPKESWFSIFKNEMYEKQKVGIFKGII